MSRVVASCRELYLKQLSLFPLSPLSSSSTGSRIAQRYTFGDALLAARETACVSRAGTASRLARVLVPSVGQPARKDRFPYRRTFSGVFEASGVKRMRSSRLPRVFIITIEFTLWTRYSPASLSYHPRAIPLILTRETMTRRQ